MKIAPGPKVQVDRCVHILLTILYSLHLWTVRGNEAPKTVFYVFRKWFKTEYLKI